MRRSCSTATPIHAATSGSVASSAGSEVASDPDWNPFCVNRMPAIESVASP